MNEPKLRFKADDGSQFPDWEEKTIDEVAECLDNKRVPVNSEERKKRVGIIPYYGAGGIQGYIDDYLFDEELVLLLEDGDAFDDFQTKSIAQYVTGKSWVNNHAHVLRANGNSYFLFASLEHKDIRRWTQLAGASRKKLLKDSMLKITVNMPSLPEQQKIAEFLSTIDTVIGKQKETVSAWEERKKGVMQKLFSQEVRFKADDGSEFPEWEEKDIGELVTEYTEKTTQNNQFEVLSSTHDGIKFQKDHFNKKAASADTTGYKVVPKGYFTYRAMSDNDVFVFNRQMIIDKGIVSPAYPVFDVIGTDKKFFEQYINNTDEIRKQLITSKEGGTRYALSFSKFCAMHVTIPSDNEEQQKIADCLSSLDKVIEKQKATLAAWEEMKKGLLQQMFL